MYNHANHRLRFQWSHDTPLTETALLFRSDYSLLFDKLVLVVGLHITLALLKDLNAFHILLNLPQSALTVSNTTS